MTFVNTVQSCAGFLLTLPRGKSTLNKALFAAFWVIGGYFAGREIYHFTCKKSPQLRAFLNIANYFGSKKRTIDAAFRNLQANHFVLSKLQEILENCQTQFDNSPELFNHFKTKFKRLEIQLPRSDDDNYYLFPLNIIATLEMETPRCFVDHSHNIIWVGIEFTKTPEQNALYFAELPHHIKGVRVFTRGVDGHNQIFLESRVDKDYETRKILGGLLSSNP